MAEREPSSLAWPGLAGLLAVVAGFGLWQGGGPAVVGTTRSGGPERAAALADAPAAMTGGAGAFAVFAEALNVSLTELGVVRDLDAVRARVAARQRDEDRQILGALDTLRTALARGLAGRQMDERQRALDALENLEGYAARQATGAGTASSGELAPVAAALARVARHVRATADEETFALLQATADSRRVRDVQFLVASIPDYVDSNSDWMADDLLEGLHRAANKAGFVLDRFAFPEGLGGQPRERMDGTAGRLHETEPGLVLFKSYHLDGQGRPEIFWLAIFVVTETATAGLHESAFRHAAEFVRGWREREAASGKTLTDDQRTLKIVGPVFSGSSVSLRGALERFLCESPTGWPNAVSVRSGTASAPENRRYLTFEVAPGAPACASLTETADATTRDQRVTVRFAATVRSDKDLFAALSAFLGELNPEWGIGRRVALLVEASAYGLQFSSATQDLGVNLRRELLDEGRPEFRDALTLRFPLHISRLRGLAEQRARPGAGTSALSVQMDQRAGASDALPAATPELTLATVQLSLANILATIAREQITAVGIFATDKRDLLFLSREIAKAAPNVLVFTTEGHVLLTHQDYASFTRGTVVASTYPLFDATQVFSDPDQRATSREQFSTHGSQGVYNATLSHIAPWEPLLDYAPLATMAESEADGATRGTLIDRLGDQGCLHGDSPTPGDGCIPPVWISVVGQYAMLPVRAMGAADGDPEYTLPGFAAWWPVEPPPTRSIVLAPPWMNLAILGVLLVTLGHVGLYVLSSARGSRIVSRWRGNRGDREGTLTRILDQSEEDVAVERRRFVLCSVMAWGMVAVWFVFYGVVAHIGGPPPAWAVATLGAFGGSALLGGVVTTVGDRLGTVRWFAGQWSASSWRTVFHRHWVRATSVGVMMALMAAAAIYHFVHYVSELTNSSAVDAQASLVRALAPSNGVSPAATVVLLGAVFYLWSIWHVQQLSMRGVVYARQADSGLFRLLCGETVAGDAGEAALSTREPLRLELGHMLASPWRRSRFALVAAVVGATGLYGLAAWDAGFGIDGRSLSGFLWWSTCLAVFATLHGLSQTVHLATLLLRMLRQLRLHHMAPAFGRVAKEGWFEWRLTPRPNRALALTHAIRLTRSLSWRLHELSRAHAPAPDENTFGRRASDAPAAPARPAGPAPSPLAMQLRVRTRDTSTLEPALASLQTADAELAATPDEAFQNSPVWNQLVDLTGALIPVLDYGFWRRPGRAETDQVREWRETGENLIALQAAFVIRDVLSRIVTGLGVVLVLAFLILGAHLFYSFQGRQLFIWLDLLVMGAVAAVGVTILVVLEKDRVLSLLWSTDPGRLNWNGRLVYRIGLYVGIPFLTILLSQFPELAGSIAGWLEPLQKALP